MRRRVAAALLTVGLALAGCAEQPDAGWSAAERAQILSLSIDRLGPPPPDPSNRYADDPRAAQLGLKLFFDTRLSRDNTVSCAKCHQPDRGFTDGLARAVGLGETRRNAPSLIGVGYSRWHFWDGRADSLWSQVFGPLEHAQEQGMSRPAIVALAQSAYRAEYEAIFGPMPARIESAEQVNRVVVNLGKAIAAYERQLIPELTRFDAYARALAEGDEAGLDALDAAEQRGLRLFIGRGQCQRCHAGPRLTNDAFHNTGLVPREQPGRLGRAEGLKLVLASEFNCAGPYSDDPRRDCPHLRYARTEGAELVGAFKTPSLRNVARTAPYMHDGRFTTLGEVLVHYNRAASPASVFGHSELFPLGLTPQELNDLEAFLRAL